MTMMGRLRSPGPQRMYILGVASALVAVFFAAVSMVSPRIGYPLAFVFTMYAVMAISQPSWAAGERRVRLLLNNLGVFAIQLTILYVGLSAA